MSNQVPLVLIVDDEPIGRQLLEAILQLEDYSLEFAENGRQAYDKAVDLIPDLILLDVMMPEIDGYEVCKRLRKNTLTSHVPIFLITALDDRDSRIRGLEAGADDYISKPLDRVEILAKVKTITQLKRYRNNGDTDTENQGNHQATDLKNADISSFIGQTITSVLNVSPEQLKHTCSDSVIIDTAIKHNSLIWSRKVNNKSILFLTSLSENASDYQLINALFVTIVSKISDKAKALSAGKILNELKKDFKEIFANNSAFHIADTDLSFVLCIIDTDLEEIQFAAINNSVIVINNNQITCYNGIKIGNSTELFDINFTYQTFAYETGSSLFMYSKNIFNELNNYSQNNLPDSELGLRFIQSANNNFDGSPEIFTEFLTSADIKSFKIMGMKF